MDPLACLLAAEDAIFHGLDLDTASERLNDYDAWRKRYGFEPGNVTGEFVKSGDGDVFAKRLRTIIRGLRDSNVD